MDISHLVHVITSKVTKLVTGELPQESRLVTKLTLTRNGTPRQQIGHSQDHEASFTRENEFTISTPRPTISIAREGSSSVFRYSSKFMILQQQIYIL